MKNSRTKLFTIAVLTTAILLSGCATRIGNFPILTTVKPDYSKIADAPLVKDVTGSDSRIWLLCIPLGGAPTLEGAVDACLDTGHGDFLARARLFDENWTLILFSYGGYSIVADVGNSKYVPVKSEK